MFVSEGRKDSSKDQTRIRARKQQITAGVVKQEINIWMKRLHVSRIRGWSWWVDQDPESKKANRGQHNSRSAPDVLHLNFYAPAAARTGSRGPLLCCYARPTRTPLEGHLRLVWASPWPWLEEEIENPSPKQSSTQKWGKEWFSRSSVMIFSINLLFIEKLA